MNDGKTTNKSKYQKIVAFAKNEENAVPLKVLIYNFHGGAVCIFPFVALHMQLLGVSIKEIAVVSLITPITALLGPILTGLVADKVGRYGLVLVFNIMIMILSYDLLLAIPRVAHLNARVSCDGNSITIPGCGSCFHNVLNDTLEVMPTWNSKVDQSLETFQNSTGKIQLDLYRDRHTVKECKFNVIRPNSEELCHWKDSTMLNPEFTILKSKSCNDELTISYSSSFYMFLFFRTISSFSTTAAFSMLDTSILAEAKRLNLSIGKQRVMVMIGYASTPLISGALTDFYSAKVGYQSHMPAFVFGSILLAISAIIMSNLDVRVKHNKQNVVTDLLHLIKRTEVRLFLLMLLLLGSNFGFIESYLFIFMNSLGSPAIALGLTITVGCTASIPVLYFSDWINQKISRDVIYLICFSAYALRFTGYSLISNPWLALIFESLEAINYQLMWVTSLKFFPMLAPKRMLATMTGLAMATHYAFGQGIGGFLGGFLIEWYGYPTAFQIMAIISLFAGVFCFLADHFIIRQRISKYDLESSE